MERSSSPVIIFIIMYVICLKSTSTEYVCSVKTECASKAGNSICDPNCNNLNCSYDSGDCLLQNNPWSKCTQATKCRMSFYNDTCDPVCNNEVCLYDQMKCKPLFNDDCITNCTYKWGNEVCDPVCNKVQCGYDGNDCTNTGNIIPGFLIVYAKSVIPRPSNTARFIGFALSLATRTIVSVKTSTKYNGSVPEIESLGEAGVRVQYNVQNIPGCNSNTYTYCWTSVQNVASYGAAVAMILNSFLQSIEVNVTITKVLACMDGYYGENCDRKCNDNCKSGCKIFDGTCINGCMGNYYGDMCTSLCSPNCKLGCLTGSTCISGQCSPGFSGVDCTIECSTGTYGSNCVSNCSRGCLNNICSKTDGTCSCFLGYNGTMCEKVCLAGYHGPDCLLNCSTNCMNNTCDAITGDCSHGCVSGWTGRDCTTDIQTIDYTTSTSTTGIVIAIVVVVCVLVVCLLITVIVLWGKGQKDNYQSHLDTKIYIGEGHEDHSQNSSDQVVLDDTDSLDTTISKERNEAAEL